MNRAFLTTLVLFIIVCLPSSAEERGDIYCRNVSSIVLEVAKPNEDKEFALYSVKCYMTNYTKEDRMAKATIVGVADKDAVIATLIIKGWLGGKKSNNFTRISQLDYSDYRKIKKWKVQSVTNIESAQIYKLFDVSKKAITEVDDTNKLDVKLTVKIKNLTDKEVSGTEIKCLDKDGYECYCLRLSEKLPANKTIESSNVKRLDYDLFKRMKSLEVGY